jgi:hypothetical protein
VSTQNIVQKYEMRQIKEDTIQNFQLALETENCEEIYKQDNINNKFHILNIFLIEYENSFPLTQRRYLSNDNKWITTGIRISSKCKRSLYMPVKASHNHVLKAFRKKYCYYISEGNKRLYYYELKKKKRIKYTVWMIIKKETPTMQKTDNISQMRIQDKQGNNPK